ncbi:LysR family transcriptional regulator [Hahella sp. CR1]|uniref:LysR family transcriptional regulator n=1 Tax=Hahella sp. CR1 TaxID=2992807 RepID=UPI0024425581|nr:LysR family transcriptional regulator [Hahella sp. CR1]MDG9669420.1 LysR family transcriptional regulator [Hahella sp. CR1]
MNLRGVDLNLLVILDALMDERHVTRAAKRLHLSQPATSSALERCRHLFGDPLLIRGRGEMRLSAKAESLREPIKALLMQAERVINQADTPLAELRQTIRILMADFPVSALLGPLHQRLLTSAPNLDLIVQPWHGAKSALEQLAKGEADLAVSVFPNVGASFRCVELLYEDYCVLMRKDHPAAQDFNLQQWLAYPHVLVSGRGDADSPVDQTLQAHGLRRRVALVVPYFQMAPDLVAQSDYIALLPIHCVPQDTTRFTVFPPPIPVEGFPLHLAWHVRRQGDQAVSHVAGVIREVTGG